MFGDIPNKLRIPYAGPSFKKQKIERPTQTIISNNIYFLFILKITTMIKYDNRPTRIAINVP